MRIRSFNKFVSAKSVDRIVYGLGACLPDTRMQEKNLSILQN